MVPYIDTVFGRHRKTLHNLLVLAGVVAFLFIFDNLQYVWIGVLSHYVLDILGSKPGIALFYPVSGDEWNPDIGVAGTNRYPSVVTLLISVFEIAVGSALTVTAMELGISLVPLLP